MHHLDKYLEITKDFRDGNLKELLISTRKPHKPVGEDTVARWIKSALNQAGIDTAVFCAHSTRSASTSAAHSRGAPIDIILKAANWKNANTFAKFYHRQMKNANESFGEFVLNTQDETTELPYIEIIYVHVCTHYK